MVTCFFDGTTRTKIMDCVNTWSALNFESSSEPSNKTVNAPGMEVGDGDCGGGVNKRSVGDGDGTVITWPVDSMASRAAGRKCDARSLPKS